jgi:hypothetical protein
MTKPDVSFLGDDVKRPSSMVKWLYYTFGRKALPLQLRPTTSYGDLDPSGEVAKWQLFQRTNRTELDTDHLYNSRFKEERDRLNKEYQFIADALNETRNTFNFRYRPIDEDWLYIRLGKNELELGYTEGRWYMDYSYIPRMEQWDHWLISEGTMKIY